MAPPRHRREPDTTSFAALLEEQPVPAEPVVPRPRQSREELPPPPSVGRHRATPVSPASVHPAAWRRLRRRRIAVWAALILLVGAGGVGSWVATADDDTPAPPSGSSQVVSTFDPPVEVAEDSSYVQTRVGADGTLQVTHWIRTGEPLRSLGLHLPLFLDESGPGRATDIEVLADGRLAAGPAEVDAATQGTYLFRSSRTVTVRYTLSDALELSKARGGRALARVTALDVTYAGEPASSTHRVEGASVLSLACSAAGATSAPSPCGSPDGGAWAVTLEGLSTSDRVMAQLDLA